MTDVWAVRRSEYVRAACCGYGNTWRARVKDAEHQTANGTAVEVQGRGHAGSCPVTRDERA